MSLDPRIRQAVKDAVHDSDQPSNLGEKLIHWLEALTSGNEKLEDRDSVERHLELLYEAVSLMEDDEP